MRRPAPVARRVRPQVTNLYLSSNGGAATDLPDAKSIVGHSSDGFSGAVWTYGTAKGTYMGSLAAGSHTFTMKYRGYPNDGIAVANDDWITKNIQILVLPE